jgi:hypothetical protein
MLERLNQTAKLRWIGQVEDSVTDLTPDFAAMYALAILAVVIFVTWCCIIQLQLYQMCPGWGPIRKFDSDGTEEMRINQLVMHEEQKGLTHHRRRETNQDENLAFLQGLITSTQKEFEGQVNALDKSSPDKSDVERSSPDSAGAAFGKIDDNGLYNGFQQSYGTIGRCTWGYCESNNQWGEPRWDPRLGREVVVRHGFADTQWMRAQSRRWAKDELYHMQENGLRPPPLDLADSSAQAITQRMVIERGSY